jgi:hypothetical protein
MEQLEVRRLMTVYNPVGLPTTATEGSTATVTVADFASASTVGSLTATVTWSAGVTTAATTPGTITGIGSEFVAGIGNIPEYAVTTSATFGDASAAHPPVNVSISDSSDNTTAVAFGTSEITAAPLGIGALNASPIFGVEGSSISFTDQFTDGNPNSSINEFTGTIDWGDGTAQSAASITGPKGGPFNVSGTHIYTEAGTYTIQYSIHDVNGASLNTTQIASPLVADISDAPLSDSGEAPIPLNAVEGQLVTGVQLGSILDGNLYATSADFTGTIDWGDGSPDSFATFTRTGQIGGEALFSVTGSHAYTAESGTFTISVGIDDNDSASFPTAEVTLTTTATVNDVPLLLAGGYKLTGVEGADTGLQTVATFTDPGGADSPASYPASIDWGDGTSSAGTVSFGGGFFSVQGSHTYTEESAADHPGSTPYIISVTLNHVPGFPQTVTSSATVSDPSVIGTGLAITGSEGTATGLVPVATFTDPGGAEAVGDYSATIDWGDGTPVDAGPTITVAAGVFTVNGNHTYAEESGASPYAVTVTISHETSAPTVVSTTATIADPAVIATAGANIIGAEGQPIGHVKVATFTDPGGNTEPLSDYAASIDWGDGTPVDTTGVITQPGGAGTVYVVTGTHTYAEESGPENPNSQPYIVTVVISHDVAPDSAPVTLHATIAEVPVVGTALPNAASAVVGVSTGPVALAKFIDPGDAESLSDYSATINFHDGSAAAVGAITYDGSTGYFTVTASHTYNAAGTFAAPTVTIVHETTTTIVQDKNAVTVKAPAIVATGKTINGLEGRVISATVASFTASNTALVTGFTASIKWGDGATTTGTIVKDSAGHFHVTGSHAYLEEQPSGYPLSITIKPTVGSSVTVAGKAIIVDAPLVSAVGINFSVKKGVAFNSSKVLGTFTDEDALNTIPNDYVNTSMVTWGDGTTTKLGVTSFHRTGSSASVGSFWQVLAGHTYTSTGVKTVTILVKDNGGATVTFTLKITVTP